MSRLIAESRVWPGIENRELRIAAICDANVECVEIDCLDTTTPGRPRSIHRHQLTGAVARKLASTVQVVLATAAEYIELGLIGENHEGEPLCVMPIIIPNGAIVVMALAENGEVDLYVEEVTESGRRSGWLALPFVRALELRPALDSIANLVSSGEHHIE